MFTSKTSATTKGMCGMCSPKQVVAITSCQGCLKALCRKHFNEHRDTLSKDLHNLFDRHDNLLQEFNLKIDRASKPSDNDNARAIFKQIDEWEITTIKHVSQAANEARADVERLFNRKVEYDEFKDKIDKITAQLKKQQESETFLETDLDNWTQKLDQLQIELNRPSKAETNPPALHIQNIDWNTTIQISSPSEKPENYIMSRSM